MLSSSRDAMVKLSKTTSPQKLFQSDCITLGCRRLTLAVYGNFDSIDFKLQSKISCMHATKKGNCYSKAGCFNFRVRYAHSVQK